MEKMKVKYMNEVKLTIGMERILCHRRYKLKICDNFANYYIKQNNCFVRENIFEVFVHAKISDNKFIRIYYANGLNSMRTNRTNCE